MPKLFKLKTLAAAAGVCAAMFAASPANALVYAVSHINVKNLQLLIDPAQTTTTVTSFTFATQNSATLGSSVTTNDDCGSFSPCGSSANAVLSGSVLDATKAIVGAPVVSENDFTMYGFPPSGADSYSRADSVLRTAELTSSPYSPTSFESIAESLLNTNGSAKAGATVSSTTSLESNLTVVGGADLTLSFEADPDQSAQISDLSGLYSAKSSMTMTFTLTNDNTGDSISWQPSGLGAASVCGISNSGGSLTGVTCTVDNDTQDVNHGPATATNGTSPGNSFESADTFTFFGITIMGLQDGDYSIDLTSNINTVIGRQVVPEPGALALVGLALLGCGFATRRRSN